MTQEFQNYEIELPAIDDNCKNGKCNHKHKHKLTNAPEQPTVQLQAQEVTQTPSAIPPPQAPDEIRTNHKELAELMPTPVNYAKCQDGDCGHEIITNSKITRDFKECPECNFNGVPTNHKFCSNCKTKEPTDKEDLEDFWQESNIDAGKIEAED